MSNEVMKQKDAVFAAVTNVVGEQEGVFNLTNEERAQVNQILFEGFKAGRIAFKNGEIPDDKKLRTYVSGLQSNWLTKDKRLNGGVQYVAKNPGSRAGSTDNSIQAMRLLLKVEADPAKQAMIKGHIEKRLAEIRPTKVKATAATINIDDLPEELRALVA